MKKIKNILILVIGVILGSYVCSIGTNSINASNVGFTSSKTTKTNIQDAIDELYKYDNEHCPKKKPYTITNLVTNGSFEEQTSTSSWGNTIDSNNKFYGSYSLKISATTSNVEVLAHYHDNGNSSPFYIKTNEKYYCQTKYLSPNSWAEMHFAASNYSSNPYSPMPVSGPISSVWSMLSTYVDYKGADVNFWLRLDNNNDHKEAITYFDGVLCVNLTDTFGAGNEPTKAWCDENISYFEGTKLIYK